MADESGQQEEADQQAAMARLAAMYRQERDPGPPLTEAERQERAGFETLPVTDDVRAHIAAEQEGVRVYRRLGMIVAWIVVGIAVAILLFASSSGGPGYLMLALTVLVGAVLLWFAHTRWLVPRFDALRAYRIQSVYRYAGDCTIGEIHLSASGKTDYFYRLALPSPPVPPELTAVTFGNWDQHPAWAGTAWRTIEFVLTKESAKTAGRRRLDNLLHVLLSLVTFYRPFALGGGAQGVMLTIRDDHDLLLYDYRNEYAGSIPALPPPPRMISRRAIVLGAGGVVALGAAGSVLYRFTHPPTPYRLLTGPSGSVNTLAFAPDGQTLASVTNPYSGDKADYAIRLWRVSDGTVQHLLSGHTDSVNGLAFAPDGQTLVSISQDKTLRFWRMSDGALLRTVPTPSTIMHAVAYAPDGQTFATGGNDGTTTLWQASDGASVRILGQRLASVFSVAYAPDGQTLATGHGDANIRLWRASDGTPLRMLTEPNTVYVKSGGRAVSFAPDGQTLLSTAYGGVRFWHVNDGTPLRTLEFKNTVAAVLFAPDGQTFATSAGLGSEGIQIWRTRDGHLMRTLNLSGSERANAIAFAPDGTILASGQLGTIRLWQLL